jgi:putative transposase
MGTGAMSRKSVKYRLYPNRGQRERWQATLEVCRELYNAALQERRHDGQLATVA